MDEGVYSRSMPSKNSLKLYDAPAYYHVYNRGAGKAVIFHDVIDKAKFTSILARHLDPENERAQFNLSLAHQKISKSGE